MKKHFFLNVGLLITVTIFLLTSIQAQTKSETDRSPSAQSQINYKDDQQSYKIKMEGDKMVELYVNDQLIIPENYGTYEKKIKKILINVKEDKERAERDNKQSILDQQQIKLQREQAMIHKKQAEMSVVDAQRQKIQAELIDREKLRKDQQQSISDQSQATIKLKQQAEQDVFQAKKYKMEMEQVDRQKAEKDMEQAEKDEIIEKKEAVRATIDAKHAEDDRQLLNNLINDLVKENIVGDEKDVSSIVLTADEFSVNGKKQTEILRNKFKATYLKKKGTKINYLKTKSSSRFSITSDDDAIK